MIANGELKGMYTRRVSALAVSAALVAGLCGATSASAKTLVLGGNPEGSLYYSMAQAIAATVTKHSGDKVDVLPQGSTVFFPMFGSKEVDLGIVNPMDARSAYDATWPYEKAAGGKGYKMQTVMLGSPIRLSMVTTESSGIKRLEDLKGKRVVADYGAFGGSTITAVAALANAGMSPKDVNAVKVSSYPEGVRAVMEGRAVAAVASLGSGIVQELDASKKARILPIDRSAEAMARARKVGPAYVPMLVKKGVVPGVNEDTWVLSYAISIMARPDLDDATVARFVKTVHAHYKELPKIHRSLTTWTPDRFASDQALIPYHPGAIKAYKELGMWNAAMEKHQAGLLKN